MNYHTMLNTLMGSVRGANQGLGERQQNMHSHVQNVTFGRSSAFLNMSSKKKKPKG